MDKKTSFIIVFLLLIASFLAGSTVAKVKYSTGETKVVNEPSENSPQNQNTASFEPKKNDKPDVKFFVMSFCPYGNQAEEGLEPVYQLLKDKVNWQPRYIVNDQKSSCEQSCSYKVFNTEAEARCKEAINNKQVSDMETCKKYFPYESADECLKKECAGLKAGTYTSLHGQQELNQNVREICALAQTRLASTVNALDKWWKFISLVNTNCSDKDADTCWTKQAEEAGLNTSQIASCVQSQTKELLDKEIAESTKYNAQGSPTVYINDTLYNGGRSPEDYKKAICLAFENPPEECQTVLGSETAPSSGGCGN
ncbi:hypothetical protein C4578_04305 [Candidatus Microgenomates bacterium]|jgi:glutaredoxin|nr:MAG: hypothetical protein C4578_04305 [Candidatus Microgenomates bacterium]